MVFKKFLDSMERGLGFGVGLLIIAAFAFGVYAFVEPSTGPSSDFYYNTESPITSNNTLEFVGYSATTDGNIGGVDDANTLCDTAYGGSRWMNYNDFLRMSHLYNYTYEVWINDAIIIGISQVYTRDGNAALGAVQVASRTCSGYTSNSGASAGIVLETDGTLGDVSCSTSRRLACVRGQ